MKKVISMFALMVVFLISSTTSYSFSDVTANHPYYSSISGLTDLKVISGYKSTNTFKPEKSISRAEFIKILIAYNYPSLDYSSDYMQGLNNCFPDVQNSWYSPYVCFYKSLNVVNGDLDGYFYPNNPINLAEASKILSASLLGANRVDIYTQESWYTPYIEILSVLDIIPGNTAANHYITRGEAVEMIWRIKNLSMENLENKSLRHIFKEKDNILHELDILSDGDYLYYFYKETDKNTNTSIVSVNRFYWQANNFNFLDYDTAFSDSMLFLLLTEKETGKGKNWKPVYVMYDVHVKSFEKINGYYSKDKNNVYFLTETVKGVDLDTVEKVDDNYCVKDKNGVYCLNKVVEGADPVSFEYHFEEKYSTDKNNVYSRFFDKIEGADPKSFTYLSGNFYYDKNHLFSSSGTIISTDNLEIDFANTKVFFDKNTLKTYFNYDNKCYDIVNLSLEEFTCPLN